VPRALRLTHQCSRKAYAESAGNARGDGNSGEIQTILDGYVCLSGDIPEHWPRRHCCRLDLSGDGGNLARGSIPLPPSHLLWVMLPGPPT